jgi:subtilisin family serine protease
VFGVAAAYPRNGFGSAGTGGNVVKPMLIRYDGSFTLIADAVRSAALSGADVINLSWGGGCNSLCRNFAGGNRLQADLGFAANLGVINVASAGNKGQRTCVQTPFGRVCIQNPDLLPLQVEPRHLRRGHCRRW